MTNNYIFSIVLFLAALVLIFVLSKRVDELCKVVKTLSNKVVEKDDSRKERVDRLGRRLEHIERDITCLTNAKKRMSEENTQFASDIDSLYFAFGLLDKTKANKKNAAKIAEAYAEEQGLKDKKAPTEWSFSTTDQNESNEQH